MRRSILFLLSLSVMSQLTMADQREWTDNTGAFKVEAELIEFTGETVRLRRASGMEVSVPLTRLSAADQAYLRSLPSDTLAKPKGREVDAWKDIEAALKTPCQLDLVETPLQEVIDYLTDSQRFPILLDSRALDDVGIGTDIPVSLTKKDSLRAVLDDLLDELDLTWCVQHDVLLITTREEAERLLEARVYKLSKPANLYGLADNLEKKFSPTSWSRAGGPGSLTVFPPNAIVVAQSGQLHRQIAKQFANLLQAVPPPRSGMAPLLTGSRVADELNRATTLDVIEMPLKDVVANLAETHGLSMTLDEPALDDVGIGIEVPITKTLKGIPLRSVLSLMLRDLDLTWSANKDGIRIATPEAAESDLVLIQYPASDLTAGGRMDTLLEVVQSSIGPTSWNRYRGPGSARPGAAGTLDVQHTFQMHLQLSALLDTMRQARK